MAADEEDDDDYAYYHRESKTTKNTRLVHTSANSATPSNSNDWRLSSSAEPGRLLTCPVCLANQEHPLWVYMVTINEEGILNGVLNCAPQVGLSRSPPVRLNELNRVEGYRPGSKNSLAGAPYWQLELIIGPFVRGGTKFKKDWLAKSRTAVRRLVFGILMADNWNERFGMQLTVYARNKDNSMKLVAENQFTVLVSD